MHTKTRLLRATLLGLVAFASSCLFAVPSSAAGPVMTAHYIDVGQGACALLEFPCGVVLIDTGGDSDARTQSLVTYLNEFFARRTDLNRTLDAVYTTHPHIDHTRGLRAVVENFTVKRYLDDGEATGSGRFNPNWLKKEVKEGRRAIKIRELRDEEIAHLPHPTGLTDGDIDPLKCDTCDPVITVLAGGHEENPGWSEGDFENMNNHSVVIRVDFGKASFLFTGDLEESGINLLTERYQSNDQLDVDVYMVGHHGAANATTPELLEAITPTIAVMGTGQWTDGKDPFNRFSTFAYGHPRAVIVKQLTSIIEGKRTPAKRAMIADGAKKFRRTTITKRIYATGWDGTIDVTATLEGDYTVKTGR
jgi:competence protein ComEC